MNVDQLIQLGLLLVGLLSIGLTLISFNDIRAKSREETRLKNEEKLQANAHEQAKRIENLKESRVDSLFAGMAQAMKQMQDQQKEMSKEYQGVLSDLRQNRAEMQLDRQSAKIEIEHIKETLKELRTEVKSIVVNIPGSGGLQRVTGGPKFPGG
jgi:23S rRNA pseudoU1915 N3-methylase RlmH